MTMFLSVVAVLVVILALVAGLAWAFQEKIAFQPESPPYPSANDTRRIDYTAGDGQQLFAYLIGDPQNAGGTIIAFHGNADLAVRQIGWAERIASRSGLAIIIPEYRGYMGLAGRPSYEASRADAAAALRQTLEIGADPERLIYYGHSLGSAIAAELALDHPPQALLLEAPFTSARDMAALFAGRWFTSTVWPIVSRLHFDTVSAVASLDVPVSVTHGQADRVIPHKMGERVFSAARNKRKWLSLESASHSDIRLVGGDEYWEWLFSSLQLDDE